MTEEEFERQRQGLRDAETIVRYFAENGGQQLPTWGEGVLVASLARVLAEYDQTRHDALELLDEIAGPEVLRGEWLYSDDYIRVRARMAVDESSDEAQADPGHQYVTLRAEVWLHDVQIAWDELIAVPHGPCPHGHENDAWVNEPKFYPDADTLVGSSPLNTAILGALVQADEWLEKVGAPRTTLLPALRWADPHNADAPCPTCGLEAHYNASVASLVSKETGRLTWCPDSWHERHGRTAKRVLGDG